MDPRPVSAPLAAALVVLGTVLAVGPALLATGVVAGLPLALYALVRRSGRLAAYALGLAVLATLLTGLVIGSDLRGCPRDVSTETCLEEAD